MQFILEELKDRPIVYSRFGNGIEASKPVLNRKPQDHYNIMYHNMAKKSRLKKQEKFKEFIKLYEDYKQEILKVKDSKQNKIQIKNLRNQFIPEQESKQSFEKRLPVFKTVSRDQAVKLYDLHEKTPPCTHYNPNFQIKEKRVKGFLEMVKQKSPKCLLFGNIKEKEKQFPMSLTERESIFTQNEDTIGYNILTQSVAQSVYSCKLSKNQSEKNLSLLSKTITQNSSTLHFKSIKDQPFTKQKQRELISESVQKQILKQFPNTERSQYFPDIVQKNSIKAPNFDLIMSREDLPDYWQFIKNQEKQKTFVPIQKRNKKWPDATSCFKNTRELFMKYHKNFSLISQHCSLDLQYPLIFKLLLLLI